MSVVKWLPRQRRATFPFAGLRHHGYARRIGGGPASLCAACITCVACIVSTGCAFAPSAGPNTSSVRHAQGGQASQPAHINADAGRIEVIELTPEVIGLLRKVHDERTFAQGLGNTMPNDSGLGAGDTVAVTIWEAPPATLFGGDETGAGRMPSASRATALPDQVIDAAGNLSVPFAGSVRAAGLPPAGLASAIAQRLRGKANGPQVLVRVVRNATQDVTVVGDVSNSMRMPLTPKGERLLDALAAAGGVRQPVGKVTLQVTRGAQVFQMPLDKVIRDPRQNVPLRAGDVITALYQPLSFMALGATGKNDEVGFEGQGISLAQALARVGGVMDSRGDPEGVFVFRLEDRRVLEGQPDSASRVEDAGTVPTVYSLNLKDPAGMFLAQQFMMSDRDTLYVSNAPLADIRKLADLFYTIVFPAVSVGAQLR